MNLTELNLYGNSLIHNDSIDAILHIGIENLEYLNIGKTSILP